MSIIIAYLISKIGIINFTETKLYESWKKYLKQRYPLENKLYLYWGLSDSNYEIERHKIKINV